MMKDPVAAKPKVKAGRGRFKPSQKYSLSFQLSYVASRQHEIEAGEAGPHCCAGCAVS